MKKLFVKDRKLRQALSSIDHTHFIFKSIFKNINFFILIRWAAFLKLQDFTQNFFKVSIVNRCLSTTNKKRFSKLTALSRHAFLKSIRSGNICGIRKSSW